jgi:DNA-binding transcriptional LysR family regulator
MEPITLRQLEFALAVEEAGAICAAAKLLHISQPSLSQQIQQLEKALGVELFGRTPAGTEPTEAGRVFLTHARNALEDVRRARVSVAGLPKRPLRVGIEDLVDLAPVIAAANDTFGAVAASAFQVMRHPTAASLGQALQSQQVDLAVGSQQPGWEGMQVALGMVRLDLMTPPDTITEDLGKLPWFQVVGTQQYVAQVLDQVDLGTAPRIVEAESFEFARAMVSQGLGVSLVPESAMTGSAHSESTTPTVRVPISVMANTLDSTSSELVSNLLRRFGRQARNVAGRQLEPARQAR